MGPGFFFLYIVINVFVVLNMSIAIISDAYAEVSEETKKGWCYLQPISVT